jgi:hypothetical protein
LSSSECALVVSGASSIGVMGLFVSCCPCNGLPLAAGGSIGGEATPPAGNGGGCGRIGEESICVFNLRPVAQNETPRNKTQ